MTEGGDPDDDRQTDDDVPDNRAHSGDTDQQGHPRDSTADQMTGSGTPTELTGEAHRTGSSTDSDSETKVELTEEVRCDEDWVDLGARPPSGEELATGDLPPEKRREYTTDPRSLAGLVQVHWGIRVTLGALVVGLVATWGLGRLGFDSQWGGAVVVALVLAGLAWVVLYYRRWTYQIRADAIYLERGVVTHVRTLIPYVRIQHVDTSRSPIERTLGLSTLVVYTAGSRGADVSIPGLRPDQARDLQRRVKELAIEAEGDDAL